MTLREYYDNDIMDQTMHCLAGMVVMDQRLFSSDEAKNNWKKCLDEVMSLELKDVLDLYSDEELIKNVRGAGPYRVKKLRGLV